MGKRRAYEVSKDWGVDVKTLMGIAEQLEISIKNHMSNIDDDEAVKIQRFLEAAKQTKVVEKRVGNRIIRRRKVRRKKNRRKIRGKSRKGR